MLHEKLKTLRELKDFKQKDIAEKLGIKQQQYSRYESGEREMPLHLVIKCAYIYNVSLDYICGILRKDLDQWERDFLRVNDMNYYREPYTTEW